MRTLIRITITALLMSGALPMGKKEPLYYRMAKAIFIKIDKGHTPLDSLHGESLRAENSPTELPIITPSLDFFVIPLFWHFSFFLGFI